MGHPRGAGRDVSEVTEAFLMHQASTAAGAAAATTTTIVPTTTARDVVVPAGHAGPNLSADVGNAAPGATPVCDVIIGFVDRWRGWLFGLVAVLYLAGFNGVWRPEPDSALYMTIGKNLAEGRGYTFLGKVDALAYPGLPYLWAGVFKLFGPNNLFVPHLLILLMTAVTLVLTYAYFKLLTSRPMAVIVTLSTAVAHQLYLCTFQLRNDVPFLLGVMAFLAGYEAVQRRWRKENADGAPVWGLDNAIVPWALMVVGLGIAVVMRPTMYALVGAIVLAAVWSVVRGSVRKRYASATLVVVMAAVVAFVALDPRRKMAGRAGGQYEQVAISWIESPGKAAVRLLSPHTIESFCRSTMEAMFGHELGRGVNVVVTVTLMGIGLWLMKRRPLWFFYLLATMAMMLLMASLDVPNTDGTESGQLVPRHFLGALPLLMYVWWRVAIWMERHLPPKYGLVMVVVMACVAFGPNVVKSCETLGRQRLYGMRTARGETETNTFEELGKVLRDRVPENATVVVPHKHGREFAFYGGRNTAEANPALQYRNLRGPVYVLEQGENTVNDFLRRNRLMMGNAIDGAPGRLDWRGRQQREWALHEVIRRPFTAASKPAR